MTAEDHQAGFRRWYGAGPGHLVVILVNVAISGYALTRIVGVSRWGEILAWLGGAIVLHDFVLFPLLLVGDWTARQAAEEAPRSRVPVLNHIRLPIVVSALLLVVFFPLVLRLRAQAYSITTGLSVDPYLWRWLGITVALLAGSAALYAVRLARARRS